MMLRLGAAAVIISACGYAGFEKAAALRHRGRVLGELVTSFSMLENCISVMHMPLCEIYMLLSRECRGLSTFYTTLYESRHDTTAAWANAVAALGALDDSDKRILTDFASSLGKCNISAQLESVAFAQARLRENAAAAKAAYTADAAMYRTLSVFVGVGIAVLLI